MKFGIMIIISWDVGVIYLAYCILEYNGKEVNILDWDSINLMEDCQIKMTCDGYQKNDRTCNKKASHVLSLPNNSYGFCKTHLSQWKEYWSNKKTEKLFKHCDNHKCRIEKKNGEKCGKNAKFYFRKNKKKVYLCTTHHRSELKKKCKEFSPQPIKKIIVSKYPTSILQLKLVQKLDSLIEHFSTFGIEQVIIENQPSQKNPKMKAIASTLFDYFLIRCYVDKIHNMNVKEVKFICPSNKLKVNKNNTDKVLQKSSKNQKYKLTKQLGIKYTKELISSDKKNLKHLNSHKKQDDMCDAYLQGRYYLENRC